MHRPSPSVYSCLVFAPLCVPHNHCPCWWITAGRGWPFSLPFVSAQSGCSQRCPSAAIFRFLFFGCDLPCDLQNHCPCTCITAFFGRPVSLPWRSTQSGCSHWCSSHISFVVCLVSGYLALDQCLASGIVAVAVQTKYHVQGLKKRKERYTVQVRTVLVVG